MVSATGRQRATHNNSVVPGKDGQLIEPSHQVPAGGDVAGDKDPESQDGEGVHRIHRPYEERMPGGKRFWEKGGRVGGGGKSVRDKRWSTEQCRRGIGAEGFREGGRSVRI